MPLSAGIRLGPYEILSRIGAGGMGEVYKARDPRLNRDVALKILPAQVATDPVRRRRFEQEARAASALNHPNIVSVYDVGTEGDTSFIVTELVVGDSLRSVLQHGTLPMRKLLDLAVQIADGLAIAHAAGIVHRDLKPDNVMLTRDGRVKILDFGLAKTIMPVAAQSELTQSIASTEPGVVLGTVSYLSPEQARGSMDLDGRSDQFSFGLLLYELVTGKKPFDRPSAAETMTAIIREEPAPLSATTPIPFRWTIERCLAKEPSQRYDTTHDLFLELRHLRDHITEIATGSQIAILTTRTEPKRRGVLMWIWTALVVLGLAAAAYVVGVRVLETSLPSFERLTYRRGDVSGAAFSPDGQTVLFSAQWAAEPTTIFSMRPGSRESRSLDLPTGRLLSISSSGEMAILLGTMTPGTLARVPLAGGAPREVLENVNGADWSPDGTQLAVAHTVGRRNRIEYPIGTVLYESEGLRVGAGANLRISPKGDLIAFLEFDNAVGDYAVSLLDLHGKRRVLSRGWRGVGNVAWATKGNEVWFGGVKAGANPALYAVTLNNEERTVVETTSPMALDDITRDGRVLATVSDFRMGISFLSAGTKEERDLSWFDASRIYDMSPDGKTILFLELSYGQPRNAAIYLRKTDGSPAVRLGEGNRPALSPDGKWVVCIRSEGPQTKLMLLPTGAGQAQSIGAEGMHYERVEWFPDGQRILFTGNEPNHSPRTFIQDLTGGKPTPVTPEAIIASRVSPDQKNMTALVGGELSLFPVGGGQPQSIARVEPGESVIRWSRDGHYLFLSKLEDPALLRINRLNISTGREDFWKELKPPDPVGVSIRDVQMTPDGESYAYSFQRETTSLFLVKGLK
jgi:Tol biopolymer transport system component/tRNA A-37 threonylcarbamoyl transferase component Bud32